VAINGALERQKIAAIIQFVLDATIDVTPE